MTKIIIHIFCIFVSVSVSAAEYQSAELLESPFHKHPYRMTRDIDIDSGMVELVFMVDKSGVPSNIDILRSSMPAFEQFAASALLKYKYKPATMGSKPIESRQTVRVKFDHSRIDTITGFANPMEAPEGYKSLYNTFKKEIKKEKPNKRKAAHTLKKMRALAYKTFTTCVHNELAQHQFEIIFGTKEKQLEPLLSVLMYEDVEWAGKHALDEDTKLSIKTELLELMLELGHNAEALQKYNEFSKNNSSITEEFSSYIEKIKEIQKNDIVVERKVTIAQRGYTFLPLLKRSFVIESLKGQIDSFKLRCDAKFAKINFKADAQYQLPESWGSCELQLIGTPDSIVSVLQQ